MSLCGITRYKLHQLIISMAHETNKVMLCE